MSVVRVEKNTNYTVLSNYHLRDKNLSLKAKGLLSVVLSLPDNWDYSIEGLVSIFKEERRAVKNTIEELVQNKYLIILKLKATKNVRKNIEYIYTFYEKPFNQEDLNKLLNSVNKEEIIKYDYGVNLDNVDIHNVCLQEDTQINKDIINKEELNKDNNSSISIKEQIIDLLQDNGFIITPLQYETINTWCDYDYELIKYVIRNALNNNKINISYIDKVLYNYHKKGIKTVQQAVADDENFKEKAEKRTQWRYETASERKQREQNEAIERWLAKDDKN